MQLLERDTPLRELGTALKDAVAGEGRMALVSGEAGIGKTSLVDRFTREHQTSARVLWGACDSLFTPRPLGPLHDMATQIRGNLPTLLNSDANRTTIFSTILAELQSRPTIAVFEDVHWADEATLDLLKFLGRRIQRTRALLVVTYRDDELDPKHPLRTVLGDLAATPTARRLSLAPLSIDSVRTLIGDRPLEAESLFRHSGGNPFFVTEVLSSAQAGLPATVRDAVLARVARLSPSGQAVLQAAAVIGPRIEAWALAEVTGAEAGAVEECLAIGVLFAQGGGLAFRHELARQIVLDTIAPTHKLTLHRMTLDALRANQTTRADLTRLAHHAEGAGDREAILEFAPAAAQQASRSQSYREAAALYGLALRHADDLPLDRRAAWLEEYARHSDVIDLRAEAIAARRQAAAIWQQLGNRLKEGANYGMQVVMLVGMGQIAEAEEAADRSLELLDEQPSPRHVALAYSNQATLHTFASEYEQALAWAEKTLAIPDIAEHIYAVVQANTTLGIGWMHLDYERGRAMLEQTLADCLQSPALTIEAGNILTNLAAHSLDVGQFLIAEHYLEQGLTYTIERDIDILRFVMRALQARVLAYLGRWETAAAAAEDVVRRPNISALSRLIALQGLGLVHVRRGDPHAGAILEEALVMATQTGQMQHIAPTRAIRAEAAWLSADRARALAEAKAEYEHAVVKKHPWYAGELAFWRWRAGDDVVVPEWAAKPYALHIAGDWRGAAEEWEQLGCPYEQARALADGDYDSQVAALEIFDRLGARPAADALRQQMQATGQKVPRGPHSATRENPFGLTARQTQILALLIEGLTNPAIAARLHLSPKTVDHHVSAVLAKLDVGSRAEAIDAARQHPRFRQPKK